MRRGPRLRIADTAARELDGSRRRGHPCPMASGIEVRDVLIELLGGRRDDARRARHRGGAADAVPVARPDRYRRTVAKHQLIGGRILGLSLVQKGKAAKWLYANEGRNSKQI